MENNVIKFLNKCGININAFEELNTYTMDRDLLRDNQKYENLREDIETLKKTFSSGSITALQKCALKKQKWPLFNLVRQILKIFHYKIVNKRMANGYTKDGKKVFKNVISFNKIEQLKTAE
jgi:hypothetical protein|tara:strand:+ start:4109 stop:4471 length:363 start_codon:yes stop_codon:yes gene_type:complete